MAPTGVSTVNVATTCMSTIASIKKQVFGVEIKMATHSLKEVKMVVAFLIYIYNTFYIVNNMIFRRKKCVAP